MAATMLGTAEIMVHENNMAPNDQRLQTTLQLARSLQHHPVLQVDIPGASLVIHGLAFESLKG